MDQCRMDNTDPYDTVKITILTYIFFVCCDGNPSSSVRPKKKKKQKR